MTQKLNVISSSHQQKLVAFLSIDTIYSGYRIAVTSRRIMESITLYTFLAMFQQVCSYLIFQDKIECIPLSVLVCIA